MCYVGVREWACFQSEKKNRLFPVQLILDSSNSKVGLHIVNSLCLQISSYVNYAKT